MLYVCATPIGNLEDITLRVLNTLKSVDLIAAEDTRHTVKLLNYYQIQTPLTSYHEHNKKTKGDYLLRLLLNGKNIALVSDAGMPGISDPGYELIMLCYENNVELTVLPGASACVTALVLSGMDNGGFVFDGFLPQSKKNRKEKLDQLKNEKRTIILYEAPHRLLKTLCELKDALGDRIAACVKELTKKHEAVKKDTISALCAFYELNPPKGEFVILIEGINTNDDDKKLIYDEMTVKEHVDMYITQGLCEKDAMKAAARDRGVSKSVIYGQLKV